MRNLYLCGLRHRLQLTTEIKEACVSKILNNVQKYVKAPQ